MYSILKREHLHLSDLKDTILNNWALQPDIVRNEHENSVRGLEREVPGRGGDNEPRSGKEDCSECEKCLLSTVYLAVEAVAGVRSK